MSDVAAKHAYRKDTIICPKCGQLSRDEVFLTDLGVSQLFKASLGLERKYPRIESQNLVYYGCYDYNGNLLTQGMGRTLNVSENGILLETSISIDTKYILYLTIAFGEDIMDLKGKIVFFERLQGGKFGFGIELREMNEKKPGF